VVRDRRASDLARDLRARGGDPVKRPLAGARNCWVLLERKGISVKQGWLSRSRSHFDGIVVAQNFLLRLALGFHVMIAGAPVLFTTLAAYSRGIPQVLLCYSPLERKDALVGTCSIYQQCDTELEAEKRKPHR
jgi:hypothetical protein